MAVEPSSQAAQPERPMTGPASANPRMNEAPEAAQTPSTFNVVLFGWADGKPAHIAKYQAAYPTGCDFVIMPLVVWDASKDPCSLIHQAQPVIDFLAKHGHIVSEPTSASSPADPDRGLIFHAFSNGGIHALAIVLAHLASTHSRLRGLRGLVVDCAPTPTGQRTVAKGADLFAYSLGLGPLPTAVARGVFFMGFSLQALVAKVFGWRPQLNKNRDMLLTHAELSGVPKLVMYSAGDRFVDYTQIEWVVARLVAQMVRWDIQGSLPPASEAVGGGSVEDFRVLTVASGELAAVPRSVTVVKQGGDPSQEIVKIGSRVRSGPHDGLLAAVRFPKDALHVQLIRGYPTQYVRLVNAYLAKL